MRLRKLHENAVIPKYAHGPAEDAGMDLHCIEDVVLEPGVPTLVRTGLALELHAGYEGQVRPRSGWAAKYGITIPNSPGTIDPSYRGEVKVILLWNGYDHVLGLQGPPRFEFKAGARVAQLVIARYEAVEWLEDLSLSDTVRGENGFGSTNRQDLPDAA